MGEIVVKCKMDKIKNVCYFLKSVEEEHPIPAHADLFNKWANDVRDFWKLHETDEDEDGEIYEIFEEILDFREKIHKQTTLLHNQTEEEESNGWEWLITTKQVEQRTDEWIAEAKNMITASEIGAIWKGSGTRAALVRKKATPPAPYVQQQAVRRDITNAMDWGVRYEPIVKDILQKELDITIVDLGRIRHKTIERLGASPDGLIVRGPQELIGKLVEIKCPPTRIINDTIPFEYWCQMQLQMEICCRPACEFVEAKFKELDADKVSVEESKKGRAGWISLEAHQDTLLHRYVYHNEINPPFNNDEKWVYIETYGWQLEHMRRITQKRDKGWFEGIQMDLQKFWEDVEECRAGTWKGPETKRRKVVKEEGKCCIQEDESITTTIYIEQTIPEP